MPNFNLTKTLRTNTPITPTWSNWFGHNFRNNSATISQNDAQQLHRYYHHDQQKLHNAATISYASVELPVSQEVSNDSADLIDNELVQIFFCILYSTVFVLGVFGNVLVCFVVLRNRAMQTVTNIFITNLALSDILLCVLAVPFTPLYTFMGRWAFGHTLCHLVSFAQGCSIYISTLTLTSIAVDRYFVIIYPFHPRMKLCTCIIIIISIWTIALLATLPYGMYMKMLTRVNLNANISWETANITTTIANSSNAHQRNYDAYMQILSSINMPNGTDTSSTSNTIYYCEEDWPSEHYRKVFGSVTTILQFVLPFVIISICYVWISMKLNARAKAKPGSKSSRKEEADRDRKKRTNRMLIAMVAVFGLSWLPLNVVNIFDDFYEKSNEWRFYTLFFFVAHSVAMSSTCYNPFLYAWLNENFRKEFKHVLPCFNPSNNNLITRGYNRSDRNTCGPRLHHGNNGNGGGAVNTRGSSIDNYDHDDENGITQDTCITATKEKLLVIPREPPCGNGRSILSPCLERVVAIGTSVGGGINATCLVQSCNQVEILLNDTDIRKHRNYQTEDHDELTNDDRTNETRFTETPFNNSRNVVSTIVESRTDNEIECSPVHAEQNKQYCD
uniref:G-protein coupled receptors family 1 profile domain-containing protein n=1 Tax=Glossina brevipalpis TaxID=37001 RepID=A0A1A9W8G3_9MUSC